VSFLSIQKALRERVLSAAEQTFGVTLESISAEVPPRVELGDLAFPVAFDLAKRIKQQTGQKQPPRSIAEQLSSVLREVDGVERVEIAGAGYLNIFFDRAAFLAQLSLELDGNAAQSQTPSDAGPKRMVEHTSINPNKAAHIGHLRNAVLGDSFVRILRAAGNRVEVQNYIDNTGVQVADVVIGFTHLNRMTLDDIKKLDRELLESGKPFDYYCWDLYTRVGLFYRNGDPNSEPDPERLGLRFETVHAIEEGNNPTADLADYVATRNVERILDTMERLDIRYDVLPRESEILHLHFWDRAFDLMKNAGVIHFENEGRNKGCWVMPFESHTGTDEHEADKIIVRSNGTVTYTGKDIAYQLWKLGRLGLDFNYRLFRRYADGHKLWITTTELEQEENGTNGAASARERPQFGGGATVYNVIDSRQSYTQEVVRRGVAAIVPEVGEEASVHLSYEMVALTPAACDQLGIELTAEDRTRSFIEMSGRKGLGVKADDLIDRLEANALREVEGRHPNLSDEDKRTTASIIAVGALRFFLLKFTRNSVIAFDFNEALSFEGETGPYCQYAAVRATSIFRKLEATQRSSADEMIRSVESQIKEKIGRVFEGEGGGEIWSLVLLASRLEEVIEQSSAQAEPAFLARYTFNLARAFNLFYHRHRIIVEEDVTRRGVLIKVAEIVLVQLTSALAALGIKVPERM
jgi:arginyl-tRNA synthetase